MRLDDLMEYDNIVGWGAGQAFEENYRKRIHLDYLIDKDENKIGTSIYGIPIYPVSELKENGRSKRILIIIFATKYQDEIIDEIKEMSINCDYINVWEYVNIFGISCNKQFAPYGMDANVMYTLKLANYDIEDMNYIEVGAAHPAFGSMTYAMYLRGVRGVIVEPNPKFASDIKRLRPEDIFYNCGIGTKNDVMTFYQLDSDYRGTFDRNCVNYNINKDFKVIDEIDIDVKTLDTIIEETGMDTRKTFLSINVMGLEYEILNRFDCKRYKIPIIQLFYIDNRVRELDIFDDYIEITKSMKHSVLVTKEIYDKILGR